MDWLDDAPIPAERRVYCNRTLNLRAIGAIGFDMDYTLIHYRIEAWEGAAWAAARDVLAARGWPVGDLAFDPLAFTRGLVLDLDLGNIVKPNRFGYPKLAAHGMAMLPWPEQRRLYERTFVDLRDRRWRFLNTMFSLSEACLFAQLVDRLDAGGLPGVRSYREVYEAVESALYAVHTEGHVKDAVMADPDRFVVQDPELAQALLDLRHSGRRLALITNSEWSYTRALMAHALDRYLTGTWRDLFDLVIVAARKPSFFTQEDPIYRVEDEGRGWLGPHTGPLEAGRVYHGGHAGLVEEHFRLDGESILYVGDHVFADVNVSKKLLRWRTALVVRELEEELRDAAEAAPQTAAIAAHMEEKERLERRISRLRLARQRALAGAPVAPEATPAVLDGAIARVRDEIVAIDGALGPLLAAQARIGNDRWGSLFRAGNDKSHLARQVERYADLYTSRVSNFLHATPFQYLRGPRGVLPHDDPGADRGQVG
jgi:HAD superfamily 5'-nucleotidase-like hydrolase